jgi:hypothetical protein
MGIYGEIENIEFHSQQPSFAFVKFKKVVNALKAYDNQKTLSLLLNQPSLKIMFAEHEKRAAIVGDLPGYERNDEITNFIYIGYQPNLSLPNEKVI